MKGNEGRWKELMLLEGYEHSWAPLTENLAGEERWLLIANSELAKVNGKTLKS